MKKHKYPKPTGMVEFYENYRLKNPSSPSVEIHKEWEKFAIKNYLINSKYDIIEIIDINSTTPNEFTFYWVEFINSNKQVLNVNLTYDNHTCKIISISDVY